MIPPWLRSHAPWAAALWLATALEAVAQPRPSEDEPKALEVPSGDIFGCGDIFGFTSPTDVGKSRRQGRRVPGRGLDVQPSTELAERTVPARSGFLE